MVAMLARGWKLTREAGAGVLIGAGVAGGLVQGSAGIGGPPVVAVVLSRLGAPGQQRANVLGVMTAVSLSSILPLGYHGLFTREVILISLALVPLYAAATWLGARYFSGEGQRHYRGVTLAVLGVIGVVTLIASMQDYLGT